MATFGSLFDFPDLSDDQSELSSPPDSDSDESVYSEATEDKKDAQYNLLFNSEDENDDSVILTFTLLIRPLLTVISTAFTLPDIVYKEYSTSIRIKATYTLKEKKSII